VTERREDEIVSAARNGVAFGRLVSQVNRNRHARNVQLGEFGEQREVDDALVRIYD